MTIDWDYKSHACNISMRAYIEHALQRITCPTPSRPQHSPHAWQKPQYGAKTQYTHNADNSPALDAANKTTVQEILGTLLFYGRAIDSTILPVIHTSGTQQAAPTKKSMEDITQLLNYCATHPNAVVQFIASNMTLHAKSNGSYLTASKAQS